MGPSGAYSALSAASDRHAARHTASSLSRSARAMDLSAHDNAPTARHPQCCSTLPTLVHTTRSNSRLPASDSASSGGGGGGVVVVVFEFVETSSSFMVARCDGLGAAVAAAAVTGLEGAVLTSTGLRGPGMSVIAGVVVVLFFLGKSSDERVLVKEKLSRSPLNRIRDARRAG